MANEKTTAEEIVSRLLSSMRIEHTENTHTALIKPGLEPANEPEKISAEDRFLSGLAALVLNVDSNNGRFDKGKVLETVAFAHAGSAARGAPVYSLRRSGPSEHRPARSDLSTV